MSDSGHSSQEELINLPQVKLQTVHKDKAIQQMLHFTVAS